MDICDTDLTLVCFGFETNFEVQDQHRAGSFMSIQWVWEYVGAMIA